MLNFDFDTSDGLWNNTEALVKGVSINCVPLIDLGIDVCFISDPTAPGIPSLELTCVDCEPVEVRIEGRNFVIAQGSYTLYMDSVVHNMLTAFASAYNILTRQLPQNFSVSEDSVELDDAGLYFLPTPLSSLRSCVVVTHLNDLAVSLERELVLHIEGVRGSLHVSRRESSTLCRIEWIRDAGCISLLIDNVTESFGIRIASVVSSYGPSLVECTGCVSSAKEFFQMLHVLTNQAVLGVRAAEVAENRKVNQAPVFNVLPAAIAMVRGVKTIAFHNAIVNVRTDTGLLHLEKIALLRRDTTGPYGPSKEVYREVVVACKAHKTSEGYSRVFFVIDTQTGKYFYTEDENDVTHLAVDLAMQVQELEDAITMSDVPPTHFDYVKLHRTSAGSKATSALEPVVVFAKKEADPDAKPKETKFARGNTPHVLHIDGRPFTQED